MIRLPWQRNVHEPQAAGQRTDGSPDESLSQTGAPREGGIRGDRVRSLVSGARSLQSRMTSLLAAGLMISVGAGMLAWYYAEALSRPTRAPAHASLPETVGESMTLPAFGPAALPRTPGVIASVPSASSLPTGATLRSPATSQFLPRVAAPTDPLFEAPLDRATGGLPRAYGASAPPSPGQRALERQLSGGVFAGGGSGMSSDAATGGMGEGPNATPPSGGMPARISTGGPRADALEALLQPSVLTATRAQLLPTQRLLLPKGAFIDCTLETAMDSTLPGMTTCITATDTFGADGTVVLLERGTKLIGETRGEVRQGEARVFVVWTEARTPSGVVVRLDSPGTDALGRSGLEGEVNRHFWERFGAAALVSAIDGVVQSEVQSSSRRGTVVLDPTASEDVLTEILRSTVNIPPTIRVRNGARIQVLVARDVDFGSIYELESR
jgi:type IV secretion system protein VirB10